MDWKAQNNPGEVQASPENLKICELCGTLNYTRNTECFTCGWRGCFDRETSNIEIAWRRLRNEFEAVRLEHVTARRSPVIGDFGRTKKTSCWQRWQARWLLWCRDMFFRSGRVAHRDRHEAKQSTGSPNDINK
jgi:hypothetical protein